MGTGLAARRTRGARRGARRNNFSHFCPFYSIHVLFPGCHGVRVSCRRRGRSRESQGAEGEAGRGGRRGGGWLAWLTSLGPLPTSPCLPCFALTPPASHASTLPYFTPCTAPSAFYCPCHPVRPVLPSLSGLIHPFPQSPPLPCFALPLPASHA